MARGKGSAFEYIADYFFRVFTIKKPESVLSDAFELKASQSPAMNVKMVYL